MNLQNESHMILKSKPIIWTISGADCSGGAGIAADIKTGHSLNVEVCHLITANTVQNSQQLISVNAVATDILQQQVDALIIDKKPAVIKIGLLANKEQVFWLAETLLTLKQQLKQQATYLKIVYDPVGQASVGGSLSTLSTADLKPLLPLIDIITPNLAEAKALAEVTKVAINEPCDAKALAQAIHELGPNTVIVKGGHTELENNQDSQSNNCIDYCLHLLPRKLSNQAIDFIEYQLSTARIDTRYSHGGGCSFASAISSFLAHGYLIRDAFTLSKAFINQGLAFHQSETDYYGAFTQLGWPERPECFPQICDEFSQAQKLLAPFNTLNLAEQTKLGLYVVVDSIDWLKKLLPLNLNIIQLRLKNIPSDELEALIIQAVQLSKNYQSRLFINDYWQLAIKHGAYGVHIGQEDIQAADLNAINQAGLRLGISTHGCYEFLLAQQLRPSYLAIGAIFPTKTKDMTGQIQGLENLSQLLKLATDIPIVAIGGISLQRAAQVWKTGVDSIAVVTAITEADNPEQAVADFQDIIRTVC